MREKWYWAAGNKRREKLKHNPHPPVFAILCQGGVARGNHPSKKGKKRKMERPACKRDGSREAGRIGSKWKSAEKKRATWYYCISRLSEQSWSKLCSRWWWRRRSKIVKQRTRQPANISSRAGGCPIISWHAHEFSSQWNAAQPLRRRDGTSLAQISY